MKEESTTSLRRYEYAPNIVDIIKKAIQSIINQTFKDWILYIVKDGGDADVQSIVNEFRDDRIKLFEIPHKGKPSALNYAIKQGKAKYIAYLDDDDIWYSDHLLMMEISFLGAIAVVPEVLFYSREPKLVLIEDERITTALMRQSPEVRARKRIRPHWELWRQHLTGAWRLASYKKSSIWSHLLPTRFTPAGMSN